MVTTDATVGAHILSLVGMISIVSFLLSGILLLHLIQQAFTRSGVVWGVIAALYPPGTYVYCRRNWEQHRAKFVWIVGLSILGIIMLLVLKIIVPKPLV